MPLFMFNSSVPAAANNPSNDQSPMLQDNQSTLGILGVDHITFNLNNGGQHKQVTFNQDANYVPANFPVNPPVLFTSLTDGAGHALSGGVPGLFYYSGTAAQSQSNYLIGNNGSTFLFGGLILKWGRASPGPSPGFNRNVSFTATGNTNFPNHCYAVVATPDNNSIFIAINQPSVTTTGFTVVSSSQSAPLFNLFYIAIGD